VISTTWPEERSVASQAMPALRRADWRFLLPQPAGDHFRHLVLLGGPAGLDEKLLEAEVAGRISTTLPVTASADALILLHDTPIHLEQAVRCLQPGGVLYQEVGWRRGGPARVRRNLLNLGLKPTGLYWVAPDFINPQRYLSLDVPGMLAWYLSTIYVAGTPLHRLTEWAIRLLTGGQSQAFAPFAPTYAFTATAGPGRPPTPAILTHPQLPPWLQQPGLRLVLLSSGQDDGSRVVLLPFAPGSREPIAALKLTRLTRFNQLTRSEQTTLAHLHQRLTPNLRQTIPRSHGLLDFCGLTVALENYVQGHSLWTSTGRWTASLERKIDDLHLAANWLADFHRQTLIERLCWQPAAITEWLEKPLAAYETAFGLTPAEKALFAAAHHDAHALNGLELPLVSRHLDFGPWNLFRDQDSFTVIDWEPYTNWQRSRTGPALCDLLYFLTYWTFMVRRCYDPQAELEGFRQLHLRPAGKDRLAQAAEDTLVGYLAKLGLDARFRPLLLLYTWVDRALDRLDRQQLLGTASPNTRADNRYLHYLAILAEDCGNLFPQTTTS
jgi:hypothetical protein